MHKPALVVAKENKSISYYTLDADVLMSHLCNYCAIDHLHYLTVKVNLKPIKSFRVLIKYPSPYALMKGDIVQQIDYSDMYFYASHRGICLVTSNGAIVDIPEKGFYPCQVESESTTVSVRFRRPQCIPPEDIAVIHRITPDLVETKYLQMSAQVVAGINATLTFAQTQVPISGNYTLYDVYLAISDCLNELDKLCASSIHNEQSDVANILRQAGYNDCVIRISQTYAYVKYEHYAHMHIPIPPLKDIDIAVVHSLSRPVADFICRHASLRDLLALVTGKGCAKVFADLIKEEGQITDAALLDKWPELQSECILALTVRHV